MRTRSLKLALSLSKPMLGFCKLCSHLFPLCCAILECTLVMGKLTHREERSCFGAGSAHCRLTVGGGIHTWTQFLTDRTAEPWKYCWLIDWFSLDRGALGWLQAWPTTLPYIKVFVNYLDEGSASSVIKFVDDMKLERITKYFYRLETWPESKKIK